jgi:hypothetical protein
MVKVDLPEDSGTDNSWGNLDGQCLCLLEGFLAETMRDDPFIGDGDFADYHSVATATTTAATSISAMRSLFIALKGRNGPWRLLFSTIRMVPVL